MVIEYIFIGFLSALGWWGANYYVITPYLPEPVFKETKVEEKKETKTTDASKSQWTLTAVDDVVHRGSDRGAMCSHHTRRADFLGDTQLVLFYFV